MGGKDRGRAGKRGSCKISRARAISSQKSSGEGAKERECRRSKKVLNGGASDGVSQASRALQ